MCWRTTCLGTLMRHLADERGWLLPHGPSEFYRLRHIRFEALTLSQIVYRCLGSTREPFRRCLIEVSTPEEVAEVSSHLNIWACDWANRSLGASVLPVQFSVGGLVSKSAGLEVLSEDLEKLIQSRAITGKRRPVPFVETCERLLATTLGLTQIKSAELARALQHGNAWIIIDDDRVRVPHKGELKSVLRLFDLVFGETGLSHVPIVLVTCHEHAAVISDCQSYRLERTHTALTAASVWQLYRKNRRADMSGCSMAWKPTAETIISDRRVVRSRDYSVGRDELRLAGTNGRLVT